MNFKKDYWIEIKYDEDGKPYWAMYRKGTPHHPDLEELEMMSETFLELDLLITRKIVEERHHGME